jgi:Transposase.
LVLVNDNVPPADAAEPDDWRAELVGRYTTVSGFLKMLPKVIEFGANTEGAGVLAAMNRLPDVLAYRSRLAAPLIPAKMIDSGVVNGAWKRLVFGHPAHEGCVVNRHAYTFCVLEQFSSAARSSPTHLPSGATPRPNSWREMRGRRCGPRC